MRFWQRILPYFRPYRTKVLAGLGFVLLANGFQAAGPWVIRGAINSLETEITHAALWNYALLILAVAAGSGTFRFLMRRTVIGVSRHIEYDLRQSLLNHLLTLDPGFYDRWRTGDLMTRSTSDIEQVRMVVGPALMYTVNTISGLVFSFSLMAMINVKLTLLIIAVGPFISGTVFLLGRQVHKASTASQAAFSELSNTAQQNLSGIRIVKAFLQEKAQEALWDLRSRTFFRRNMRLILIQGVFIPSIMLLFGGALAAILLYGGYLIIQGVMQVGDFVAFVSYLGLLIWPMIALGWVVSLFQRGNASLDRLWELFDRRPEIADPPDPVSPGKTEGRVTFDRVTFTYPSADRPALRGVEFDIRPGWTFGVVGRVGSGKSTIAGLLARLYDVQEGEIRLDNTPIRRMRLGELRDSLAVVPQEPLLFSTTIRENITLGREYSGEEIEQALEISRLVQDLPDFPDGLETEVGERGITLSGGQKQRVAIARAVIRKPRVIILDDALSAVDAATEEAILGNLDRYLEGRTAIIITHRISSVVKADEIIVLEEGEIIERGLHADLMKAGGVYRELFHRQEMAKELEAA
ncbi:MAG TPA: ABC transporter ATP-binding protein [Bacteroidetes bacterium]|nr:ABC transporter ATP-binding protein [Bacteroidota bacterium]